MVREAVYLLVERIFSHPNTSRIAILRALQLGDLMCAVPAIRAIRAAVPWAEITLVGLPWSQEFVLRFGRYFDRFIEFPGFPGLPERAPIISEIPNFLKRMQAEQFSLAIQMQGSGSVANSLIPLFGAEYSAGFFLPGEYCPDPRTYMVYPGDQPEIIRHLRLAEFLGCPNLGDQLEFPMDDRDWKIAADILKTNHLVTDGIICIHPGSRDASRRWPAEKFAVVADQLAEKGYPIILTGSADEYGLVGDVSQRMKHPAVNLAGETDLGSLAGVMAQSRLLVCNDTGVSHVADALKVPSVVLFSGSDPERWAPLDHDLHRVIRSALQVAPQTVVDEALNLLQKKAAYAI